MNSKNIVVLALIVMVIAAIVGGIDLINGDLVRPEIQLPSNVFF